jgi:gamma-glutamylcyclotransferase (GGCT)/AIG2-like uncharacterized protein YtfP
VAGRQFVFGYGSLAGEAAGHPAVLAGWRRVWGVAMDNSVDIPGYKSYRLRADGSRPAVFVAFLDVVEAAGASVDGLLLEVDDDALRALDERERNYERVDVGSAVSDAPAGASVWTYRGTAAGRERLRRGVRDGRAVVALAYLETVRAGFASAGVRDGVEPGRLPVLDLERVDLPVG